MRAEIYLLGKPIIFCVHKKGKYKCVRESGGIQLTGLSSMNHVILAAGEVFFNEQLATIESPGWNSS